MPQYYDTDDAPADGSKHSSQPRIVHWKLVLVMIFFYYFISCGVERIYQPMVKHKSIIVKGCTQNIARFALQIWFGTTAKVYYDVISTRNQLIRIVKKLVHVDCACSRVQPEQIYSFK